MYLFWDLQNDELEILGEDAKFYFYDEDEVAIEKGLPEEKCRYWCKLSKFTDVTPLNSVDRFLVMDPYDGEWGNFRYCSWQLFREINLFCGVDEDAIF